MTHTSLSRAPHRRLLVAMALVAAPASAATVTLSPIADATLIQENDRIANGRGLGLFAGNTGSGPGFARRALVRFDLSSIPSDATITGVALTLTLTRANGGSAPTTIGMHRLVNSWTEGPSHAGNSDGQGSFAQPGDATWSHRTFDTVFWNTPGGDFVSQASASLTLGIGLQAYTWASTPALIADAQGWLANPASNFGWELVGNETAISSTRRFASREAGVSQRPRLVIEYVVPAPAAALPCLLLVAFRRRRG